MTKNWYVLLLLVSFSLHSCGQPDLIVRSTLVRRGGVELSDVEKTRCKEELSARFSASVYELAGVDFVDNKVIVETLVTDTSETVLRQLKYYFTSVQLGVYASVPAETPEIKAWADSVPLPRNVFRAKEPTPNSNLIFKATLAGVDHEGLIERLRKSLPPGQGYQLFWSRGITVNNPQPEAGLAMYLYREAAEGGPAISNDDVTEVSYQLDDMGTKLFTVRLNTEGTRALRTLTENVVSEGGMLGMVINETVYSNPKVNNSLTTGQFAITDMLNGFGEVHIVGWPLLLRAGQLPGDFFVRKTEILDR